MTMNWTGHVASLLKVVVNRAAMDASLLINTSCICGCKWTSGSSMNTKWSPGDIGVAMKAL